MDVKPVVSKLRDLAATPANRPFMIPKDKNNIPGIQLFLQNENDEVVLITLELLHHLCDHKPNVERMVKDPQVVEKVKQLMVSSSCPTVRSKASETYTVFQDFQTRHKVSTAAVISASAKTFTVYVQKVNSQRDEIERALLSVKGVVSILIDSYNQKVVVRTKTSLDEIETAIKKLGLLVSNKPFAPTKKHENKENFVNNANRRSVVAHGAPKKEETANGFWSKVSSYLWG